MGVKKYAGTAEETGEAPPAAETASLFRGSGTIGGPNGAGNRLAATVDKPVSAGKCDEGHSFAGSPQGMRRRPRALHPPFFFVLPKKNAPCTVQKKSAFGLCTQRRREIPQTLPTRPGNLLPGALSILRKPILLRRKSGVWVVNGVKPKGPCVLAPRVPLRYALPG